VTPPVPSASRSAFSLVAGRTRATETICRDFKHIICENRREGKMAAEWCHAPPDGAARPELARAKAYIAQR